MESYNSGCKWLGCETNCLAPPIAEVYTAISSTCTMCPHGTVHTGENLSFLFYVAVGQTQARMPTFYASILRVPQMI
jgi:hypothetical protein